MIERIKNNLPFAITLWIINVLLDALVDICFGHEVRWLFNITFSTVIITLWMTYIIVFKK